MNIVSNAVSFYCAAGTIKMETDEEKIISKDFNIIFDFIQIDLLGAVFQSFL